MRLNSSSKCEVCPLCPALIGGSRMISPDVPFTIEDLTSDHIFYVQNIRQASIRQDVFSFYISDGSSQTEAFDVTIDIQVYLKHKSILQFLHVRLAYCYSWMCSLSKFTRFDSVHEHRRLTRALESFILSNVCAISPQKLWQKKKILCSLFIPSHRHSSTHVYCYCCLQQFVVVSYLNVK